MESSESQKDAELDRLPINTNIIDDDDKRSRNSATHPTKIKLLDAGSSRCSRRGSRTKQQVGRKNTEATEKSQEEAEERVSPIMAVQLTLQDASGDKVMVKKDSIVDEEHNSIAQFTVTGRSGTSKAPSKLSRKNREMKFQQMIDMLSKSVERMEDDVDGLKSQ